MSNINLNNKLEDTIKQNTSNLCSNKYVIYILIFITFIFMCFFIRMNSAQYPIYAMFVIVGLLTYQYTSKLQQKEITQYNLKSRWVRILLIIYSVCFTLSIGCLKISETKYGIPLIYYVLISICIVSLFLTSIAANGKYRSLTILLILILAFNIYSSNLIVFPFGLYTSQDTHYQIYEILLPTLEDGKIPSGVAYSFFPLHHIYVAITSMIVNINPVSVYLNLVALLYIIIILFIYVVCKRTIGLIFAEFSMILYLISPEITYNATHAYQYSYALPIGILLLFSSVISLKYKSNISSCSYKNSPQSWSVLSIIMLLTIVWTHHFTSMLILSLIITNLFVSSILNRKSIIYLLNLITLFIVIISCHWIYVSFLLDDLISVVDVYYHSFFGLENYQYAATTTYSSYQVPFLFLFMDSLVKSSILSLTVIGTLYGIWKKDEYIYILASWGLFMFTLVSVGSFIKMPLLMGGRLFSLFYVVSAIYLAAKGIIILKEKFGRKSITILCVILFFSSISGLGNTSAGSETSLFVGNEPTYKFYDTMQDVKLKEWIIQEVPAESTIRVNEPWKLSYPDSSRNYIDLPVNNLDQIESGMINSGEYFILTADYMNGFRVREISEIDSIELVKTTKINPAEAEKMYLRLTKLSSNELDKAKFKANCIYTTSDTDICVK